MNLFHRFFVPMAGFAVMALLLTLAAPWAAHAITAALVQVVNTSSNPAITQDTSKQAAQIVTLICASQSSYPSLSACLQVNDHGVAGSTQYQVPASTHFILTSLAFTPSGQTGNADISIFDQNPSFSAFSQYDFLHIADLTKQTDFQFSSGISMGSAAQPAIAIEPAGTVPAGNYCIRLHGYLTQN